MDTIREILSDFAMNMQSAAIKHKDNKYLRLFMDAAYKPECKLRLPDGDPPYKKNSISSIQTKGVFWETIKKINIFQRKEIRQLRAEQLFIQALELMNEDDAKVMVAMKDQELDKLYPTITLDTLKEVGYFK